ncbi:hypothetical protein [Acetobacter okinawensis]|uniref:hypothetical protein n=1 Tax=Acetobacter okinawensis TaxID=1076594 RepID=UPI001BAC8ADD|nr:hypothetical protein [Acetobacter okinawensis]
MIIPQNDQKINSIIQKTYNRIKTSPHRIFSDKNNILQELKNLIHYILEKKQNSLRVAAQKGISAPSLPINPQPENPTKKLFYSIRYLKN